MNNKPTPRASDEQLRAAYDALEAFEDDKLPHDAGEVQARREAIHEKFVGAGMEDRASLLEIETRLNRAAVPVMREIGETALTDFEENTPDDEGELEEKEREIREYFEAGGLVVKDAPHEPTRPLVSRIEKRIAAVKNPDAPEPL